MRRWLIAFAALLCGGLALLQLAAAQGQSPAASTAAGASSATSSGSAAATLTGLAAQGHALFVSSCAACHGMSAQGIDGRGPSLHGVGALAADFYLQTGRMPLPSPRAQPLRTRPAFAQSQISALVAYVASFGGPPIPVVHPSRGSLSQGERLFGLNCAGCHTIQGQGGIVTGAIVPSLNQASPRQVAQAIRVGPYVMPRFGAQELSEGQIGSLARYVQSIQHPANRGGWGLGRIGPIPEGMVAWLLGAASLLLIARLIGERMPPQRDERRGARG
ncbi:MAG TPA: c-type cytochrome [Solirubrobacteraceae bacterium]|jgi:ubiquinol-cytochrome c reductase cytochrome c subunit